MIRNWLCLLAFVFAAQAGASAVPYAEVRQHFAGSEGIMYDRHHVVIDEVRLDLKLRRLGWVPLTEISEALKQAVIESEDRSFWSHHGVDWMAFGKAALSDMWAAWRGGKKRGASTITMQLASSLEAAELAPKSRHRRSIVQKLKQIEAAKEIESSWSKSQILEAYLNLVAFRGELQGIGAAAQGLFAKSPHALSLPESLALAALIRAPEASVSRVEARACELGKALGGARGFDCAELGPVLNRGLILRHIESPLHLAPQVAAALLPAQDRSTLDGQLQAFVLERLRAQVLSERVHNMHDAAAVVLDNASGEVLAYVGNVGELSSARFVDGVRALRQAGSTLKPFLYAYAIDQHYLAADSPLEDTPVDFAVAGGIYRPRNYDNEFHGKDIALRSALASSLNVPAVRTLDWVGVEPWVRKLREFGLTSLRDADYYGPSLALGAADVSLWELTNAYRALANGGRWSAATLLPKDARSNAPAVGRQAVSPQTAFIVSDILSDRESRSLTFGLENPLSSRFWSAAKTGTSKDMRDNWCVGYSDRYTVGVWAGNFSGEPMWNVSGISGAAPVWAEVMKWLHQKRSSRAPQAPAGVVWVPSAANGRGEWLLAGTQSAVFSSGQLLPGTHASAATGLAPVRITDPVEGTLIAVDPDIPVSLQKVFFEASGMAQSWRWVLNGKQLAGAQIAWEPRTRGAYLLELEDGSGHRLDAVHFVVR